MGKITLLREDGTDLLFAGLLQKALDKFDFPREVTIVVEPMIERQRGPSDIIFSQDYSWAQAYPPKFSFYALPSWREENEKVLGKNSALVTYAADPIIHSPRSVEKIYDVGFVGRGYYEERSEYLKILGDKYKLCFENGVDGSAIPNLLSQCKVLFNHTRPEIDINLRFFEAMALGCQVMLRTPSLSEFAVENVHYLGYSTHEECFAQIDRLLADDDLRNKIATSARSHFLSNHTYAHRARAIINHLTEFYENSDNW